MLIRTSPWYRHSINTGLSNTRACTYTRTHIYRVSSIHQLSCSLGLPSFEGIPHSLPLSLSRSFFSSLSRMVLRILCFCFFTSPSLSGSSSPSLRHHCLRGPTPRQAADVQKAAKPKNVLSINSWHLGLALLAGTTWSVVSLVWSALFVLFKVTTSTRNLWRTTAQNSGWHAAQLQNYFEAFLHPKFLWSKHTRYVYIICSRNKFRHS